MGDNSGPQPTKSISLFVALKQNIISIYFDIDNY